MKENRYLIWAVLGIAMAILNEGSLLWKIVFETLATVMIIIDFIENH